MKLKSLLFHSVLLGCVLRPTLLTAQTTFAPSPGWSLTSPPSIPAAGAPNSKQPVDPKGIAEVKMDFKIAPGPFEPTWKSIKQYYPGVPDWFRQAKFGVFVHLGPQASGKSGDWYARNLYRQGHPAYNNHLKNFGHPSEFGYKDVLNAWKAPEWDAAALTKSFTTPACAS
jgi:alpha-L-fucosidase